MITLPKVPSNKIWTHKMVLEQDSIATDFTAANTYQDILICGLPADHLITSVKINLLSEFVTSAGQNVVVVVANSLALSQAPTTSIQIPGNILEQWETTLSRTNSLGDQTFLVSENTPSLTVGSKYWVVLDTKYPQYSVSEPNPSNNIVWSQNWASAVASGSTGNIGGIWGGVTPQAFATSDPSDGPPGVELRGEGTYNQIYSDINPSSPTGWSALDAGWTLNFMTLPVRYIGRPIIASASGVLSAIRVPLAYSNFGSNVPTSGQLFNFYLYDTTNLSTVTWTADSTYGWMVLTPSIAYGMGLPGTPYWFNVSAPGNFAGPRPTYPTSSLKQNTFQAQDIYARFIIEPVSSEQPGPISAITGGAVEITIQYCKI